MRSATFAKALCLAASLAAVVPAEAVRATASATIVRYVSVAVPAADSPVAVSISTVSDGPYAYVIVAFN